MTVQASTISFLCNLAPGRSRSRTIVVIPALYPMAAVRWTGFFGSSLGKLGAAVSRLSNFRPWGQQLPLHLTAVTGRTLSRQECQRPVAGGFELPVGHGEFDVLWLVVSKLSKKMFY